MIVRHPMLAVAAALALTGCGGNDETAPEAEPTVGSAPALGEGRLPLQAADFPGLASEDCVEVAQFYLEAIGGREFERAALVWNDPVIDAARLEALFGGYRVPEFAWNEPFVEGAAGSLYCTVSGVLRDAEDPAKAPREGTLLFRRVNDVPGATADQRRWTLRSSTFVERMERSAQGAPG
jgi:hypothetical protein